MAYFNKLRSFWQWRIRVLTKLDLNAVQNRPSDYLFYFDPNRPDPRNCSNQKPLGGSKPNVTYQKTIARQKNACQRKPKQNLGV